MQIQSSSHSGVTVLMYDHAFEACFALTSEGMISAYNAFLSRPLSRSSKNVRAFILPLSAHVHIRRLLRMCYGVRPSKNTYKHCSHISKHTHLFLSLKQPCHTYHRQYLQNPPHQPSSTSGSPKSTYVHPATHGAGLIPVSSSSSSSSSYS